MEHIPLWFYIVTASVTAIGVIAGICFPVLNRVREYAEWKGRVDEHESNVTTFMEEIKTDLKAIRDFLFGADYTISLGSYQLNKLGKKVSAGINAKEWAEKLAPELLSRVEGMTKEYEIYEFCEQYVQDEFTPNEDLENLIREVTHEHGSNPLGVGSIFKSELRDALLKHIEFKD